MITLALRGYARDLQIPTMINGLGPKIKMGGEAQNSTPKAKFVRCVHAATEGSLFIQEMGRTTPILCKNVQQSTP